MNILEDHRKIKFYLTVEVLKDTQLKIRARPQYFHAKPSLLRASICELFAPAALQALCFMMQPLSEDSMLLRERLAAKVA